MAPLDENPFPLRLWAQGDSAQNGAVHIDTRPVGQALGLLDEYLDRRSPDAANPVPDPARAQGTLVFVSGEPGSGKTHLAARLIRRFREAAGSAGSAVRSGEATATAAPVLDPDYIPARESSFTRLYDSFLERHDQRSLLRFVRHHYSAIVADALASAGFPEQVIDRVRGPDADPGGVVRIFNMPESSYLVELRDRLSAVTGREDLAGALVLMESRPELAEPVLKWLGGADPDEPLREQGITAAIADEAAALGMLGALVRLAAGGGGPYTLILDDLEKALPDTGAPDPRTTDAFGRLLDDAGAHGVFLVMCGLPEFFSGFAREAETGRECHRVRMDRLTEDEVAWYIARHMEQTRRPPDAADEIWPFTVPAVEAIVDVSAGNARKVLQLCRECYEQHRRDGDEITAFAVERAAGETRGDSAAAVARRIERVLVWQGRRPYRDHRVADAGDVRAAFWVPAGDGPDRPDAPGCAIFLSGPLTLERDAERMAARAEAVVRQRPGARTLLVVNGMLSDRAQRILEGRFSDQPLQYSSATFQQVLDRRLRDLLDQGGAGGEELTLLRADIRRVSRAQAGTQHLLEDLTAKIAQLERGTRRALAETRRAVPDGDAALRGGLPEPVATAFERALSGLRSVSGVADAVAEAFATSDTARAGSADRLLLRLEGAGTARAVGIALAAENIVTAFRGAVLSWYRRGPDRPRDVLDGLCDNYTFLINDLRLDRLEELAEPGAEGGPLAVDRLDESLRDLPRTVQRTLVDS
ncbi:hypothetical protein DZF91_35490 [Actinomadura logoneensis]|uniref:AAA+ ATPase domain-containing protein n=1 Tax=Actinomadura logoneensis TaxID=2293572 RepID=A0A372JA91_9ACTN|nr:hypothetical protein DZF91_35490 [Actinomadura logoneensis]